MVHKPNDLIIEMGTTGDAAYLIVNGHARVTSGNDIIAMLNRGDLFGMIALMKDIPRTANVIAETDLTILKIAKADFITLCMQNLIVGTLISELSDQQLAELEQELKVS